MPARPPCKRSGRFHAAVTVMGATTAADSSTAGDDSDAWLRTQRASLTPDSGFTLVGMDRLADIRGELYRIEHFGAYQDALNAKKSRDNPEEYFVLYRDAQGNFCHR